MSNELRAALRAEAVKFADQFYESAMEMLNAQLAGLFKTTPMPKTKKASRQEELPLPRMASERPKFGRVTSEEVESVLADILEDLARHPKGRRAEDFKRDLKKDKVILNKAIKLGLTSDQLEKKGVLRGTTYFLPSPGAAAQAAGRVVKRKKSSHANA